MREQVIAVGKDVVVGTAVGPWIINQRPSRK